MAQRLLYPDICKFLAIFLVTCAHCAQCISGATYTNFLGGSTLDIAFNMPLFMIISGWFINLDKMRTTPSKEYIISKFKRLVIPSITWFILGRLLMFKLPGLNVLLSYWYLKALFISLCVIFISAKLIRNDILCAIVSAIVVLVFPYSDTLHVNFMFPFIWGGFFMRKLYDSQQSKLISIFVVLCIVMCLVLSPFWSSKYTVYSAPLKPLLLTPQMIAVYLYRFAIGFSFSAVIIYITMIFESKIPHKIAKWGQYSLVIYTSSLVMIGFIGKVLNQVNYHTNEYFILDVLSIVACVIIVFLTIKITDFCRHYKVLRLLLLGED